MVNEIPTNEVIALKQQSIANNDINEQLKWNQMPVPIAE